MTGALPAQLQRNFGDVGRAGGDDALACLHAAGKGDHIHQGTGGKGLAQGGAAAGDEVEHAGGEVQIRHHSGEFHDGHGRDAAGLDDGGAAGKQGRRHLTAMTKKGKFQGQMPATTPMGWR